MHEVEFGSQKKSNREEYVTSLLLPMMTVLMRSPAALWHERSARMAAHRAASWREEKKGTPAAKPTARCTTAPSVAFDSPATDSVVMITSEMPPPIPRFL